MLQRVGSREATLEKGRDPRGLASSLVSAHSEHAEARPGTPLLPREWEGSSQQETTLSNSLVSYTRHREGEGLAQGPTADW